MSQRYYSNIYWHFTGGAGQSPDQKILAPKEFKGKIKTPEHAVDILKAILSSKELRATSTERITGYGETEKFCCICDIPLKDLIGHMEYYGQAAIGFKAESIHRSMFNPVLYTTYNRLFNIRGDKIDLKRKIDTKQSFRGDGPASELFAAIFGLEDLGNLTAYIKITQFSTKEDESFYREREWRHIGPYIFTQNDIAALIVPEVYISDIREHLHINKYDGEITILPCEFIERA